MITHIVHPCLLGYLLSGARSLEISEAKRGPPQQLSSWQSAYTKRLDALGYFESAEPVGYSYPSELVRKNVEPSSDEDDATWDPEREEDGAEDGDGDDDETEEPGEADEELTGAVAPVVPQDLER